MSALAAFFSITFAITWSLWWGASRFPSDAWERVPLFLLGTFTPGLVAVAMTAREKGKAGVGVLLGRLVRWDVPLRWYAFAFFFWAAVKLAAAVLARLATGQWPGFFGEPWYLLIGATLTSWLFFGQSGEEVGWRGFALPRLSEKLGLAKASILLGVIWETWHLPLFYITGADNAGQSFPLAILLVTALSVAIAFLYWKTDGSLFLTMLMHSAINNTAPIVPAASTPMADPLSFHASTVGWMSATVAWVVAAYLLIKMPKTLA